MALLGLLVGVVASLAALVAARDVPAHFDASDPYTHKACPASAGNRVDPINVVFTGWGTWGRAASQIESHLGWTATSGTTQTFTDHGSCYPMHPQRASGEGSRFHVRVRGQPKDV